MTKNVSALGLILALAMGILPMLSHAQHALAPSAAQHKNDFPTHVTHLMKKAGYDVTTTTLTPQSNPRFNELQLDSTKTFHEYNLNAPGDSTPLHRTVYTYPEENTKVEENSQWEAAAWLPLNRTTLTHDGQNRIVHALSLEYDPVAEDFFPSAKLETYYHGNSATLIDSFAVSQWSPDLSAWVVQIATKNVYGNNNKILESRTTLGFLGVPIVYKDVYLYDANGNNHLVESSGIFDGEELTTGKTENTYLNNQLIASNVFSSDGLNFIPESRTTFLYAPFGQLARHSTMEWNVEIENWQLFQTIDYDYDEEQRVTSEFITQYESGAAGDGERISYEYLEGQNRTLETTLLFDSETEIWSLHSKKFYYYAITTNVPHEPVQVMTLSMAPNPTTGMVKIMLEEELAVQLFDATGKLIMAQLLLPGQMLDISTLPAGIYQLVAQQERNFYGGRIVKL